MVGAPVVLCLRYGYVMLLLVLIQSAFAVPVRCTATFVGPAPGCNVLGTITVDGTGRSDARASRSAERALGGVLEARAAEALVKNPSLRPEDFEGCSGTSDRTISCKEDRSLALTGVCFAQFDDALCWQGDVLNWVGPGARALDHGRALMCSDVDAYVDQLDYSNEDTLRAQCASLCLTSTRVNCIPDE